MKNIFALLIFAGIPALAVLATALFIHERSKYQKLSRRVAGLIDADVEAERVRKETRVMLGHVDTLRDNFKKKREVYDRLVQELSIYEIRASLAEVGLYEPHFDFADSTQFKAAISKNRDLQKELIASGMAVRCDTDWTLDKLALRAFNGESDSAVANVRWHNITAMTKRIERAFEQINKLNASMQTHIQAKFLALKLEELRLAYEMREKLREETETRSEAARLAREEAKLMRDLDNACQEEFRYEGLLARAKAEAASISGPRLEAFQQQVEILERDLAVARARHARAQAMAEKTTSGYVYVISNVGSFGDKVVKIGLTRRLDPMDRVRELGDASVPFVFDVHALIYSDSAPTLEKALHNEFAHCRVNAENYRKEFFFTGLSEVESALSRLAPDSPFFRDVEAQEFRQTVARRQVALTSVAPPPIPVAI